MHEIYSITLDLQANPNSAGNTLAGVLLVVFQKVSFWPHCGWPGLKKEQYMLWVMQSIIAPSCPSSLPWMTYPPSLHHVISPWAPCSHGDHCGCAPFLPLLAHSTFTHPFQDLDGHRVSWVASCLFTLYTIISSVKWRCMLIEVLRGSVGLHRAVSIVTFQLWWILMNNIISKFIFNCQYPKKKCLYVPLAKRCGNTSLPFHIYNNTISFIPHQWLPKKLDFRHK